MSGFDNTRAIGALFIQFGRQLVRVADAEESGDTDWIAEERRKALGFFGAVLRYYNEEDPTLGAFAAAAVASAVPSSSPVSTMPTAAPVGALSPEELEALLRAHGSGEGAA